jgi:hypothetical protein
MTSAQIVAAIKLGQFTNIELLSIELAIDQARDAWLSTQVQYARELGHLPVRP